MKLGMEIKVPSAKYHLSIPDDIHKDFKESFWGINTAIVLLFDLHTDFNKSK